MICKACKDEGAVSRVTPQGGYTTDMYFAPYYDEGGTYHHHDWNSFTTNYSCSRGHQWTDTSQPKCPGCDWPKGDPIAEAKGTS